LAQLPTNLIFYRTKSALSADFMLPKRNEKGYVDSIGGILLKFASAVADRKFNWEAALSFALTPIEISKIEVNRLSGNQTELLHDPNAGTGKKGTVIKKLYVSITDDGNGIKFFITVKEKEGNNTATFIMSHEEFFLFRTLALSFIPTCYGL